MLLPNTVLYSLLNRKARPWAERRVTNRKTPAAYFHMQSPLPLPLGRWGTGFAGVEDFKYYCPAPFTMVFRNECRKFLRERTI